MMYQELETIGPTGFINTEQNTEGLLLKILEERLSIANHYNHFFYCIHLEGEQVLDLVVMF